MVNSYYEIRATNLKKVAVYSSLVTKPLHCGSKFCSSHNHYKYCKYDCMPKYTYILNFRVQFSLMGTKRFNPSNPTKIKCSVSLEKY